MIIIRLKGGLGNQLFQYAFGRRISLLQNDELLLDNGMQTASVDSHREYALNKFNIIEKFASREQILKSKYPLLIISKIWRGIKSKILKINNIGYSERVLNSKTKYLEGYWQSYKYLEPIRDTLLREITLKNPPERDYLELIQKMQNTNSVSVHIRRGDYINDAKTKKAHYTFGIEYYEKAMSVVSEKIQNPHFFVFSDDITWARENIKTDFPIDFVSSTNIEDRDATELILMSKCKNNIIANSSFSFWGAWLNTNESKVVIAPSKWNNKYQKQYRNLLPPEWITI